MFKRQEVNVIDDKLLSDGILLDKPQVVDATGHKVEINLVDVVQTTEALTLSFRNIGKIENLVGFDNLIKLCLDNNSIDEIKNVGHLVNLRWLDLSFNKISKISGLETLLKLEDLSLYSNRISVIENLEQCQNLQCLSLGNNCIESLDQILKFRQLKSIRMLTLKGNPISEEAEYKMTVLGYVDGLKYLDYALVDPLEINAAKDQYHDELLDVEEKESVIAEKVARDKTHSEFMQQLDDAGIVFAQILFDDMFSEDPDLEKLKHLPGTKDCIEVFRSQFKNFSDEFIKTAMETYGKKKKEILDFNRVIKQIRTKDDSESTQLIETYEKSKKTTLASLMYSYNNHDVGSPGQSNERKDVVTKLLDELENIGDELMSIELRLVEKFECLRDEFENRMSEIKAVCLEMQQSFFRAVEEQEDKFSVSLRSGAMDLVERLVKEELAEDYLDDDAMKLVGDKDVCNTALSGSHDLHLGKILKREDEARALENRRYIELLSNLNNTEKARNRDRILQIHEFCGETKRKLKELLSMEEEDGAFDEDLGAL